MFNELINMLVPNYRSSNNIFKKIILFILTGTNHDNDNSVILQDL